MLVYAVRVESGSYIFGKSQKSIRKLFTPSRDRFFEILPDERRDLNAVFIRFQVYYRVYTTSLQSRYLA